ncbi:LrgB family protein, partial [Staphylococcus arlettae]
MIIWQGLLMIIITICAYIFAKKLQLKYKNPLLNPALISSIIIIGLLLLFSKSYDDYMVGGQWINYLLNCTVVCLAYPLYQNRTKILKHANIIFTSV